MILLGAMMVLMTSCVTGNDDSEVLRDHEAQFAKTARVTDLKINSVAISRDSLSNWRYIYADPSESLTVTATLILGNGATSGNVQLSEYQFSTSTPYGLTTEDDSYYKVLDMVSSSKSEEALSFTVTVPAADADGDPFHSGDHINFALWSWNDMGGFGYTDFTVEIK